VLKFIGGQSREFQGFQTLSFLVSNKAYDRGLKSFDKLGEHSVAVAQIGSGSHYSVTLIAGKYNIPLNTIRILPLQSIPSDIGRDRRPSQHVGHRRNAGAADDRSRRCVRLVALPN